MSKININTIMEAKNIAKLKGGLCLSTEFEYANIPLIWKCKNDHTWKARLRDVRNGSWCKKCRNLNQKKYNITDAHKLAQKMGGICMSNNYKNAKEKMMWKCNICDTIWSAGFCEIRIGHWCPKCKKMSGDAKKRDKIKGEDVNIDSIKKFAISKGGICVSNEYINNTIPMQWKCRFNHEWNAPFNSIFKSKSWCPYCNNASVGENLSREILKYLLMHDFPHDSPKWLLSDKNFQMEFDGYSENLKIAFEYNGKQHYEDIKMFHNISRQQSLDSDKMKRCNENNVNLIIIPYTIPFDELQLYIEKKLKNFGIKCNKPYIPIDQFPVMTEKTSKYLLIMQEIALSNNGKCLSHNYFDMKTKLLWECEKGHQWNATPSNIKRGHWCPKCINSK